MKYAARNDGDAALRAGGEQVRHSWLVEDRVESRRQKTVEIGGPQRRLEHIDLVVDEGREADRWPRRRLEQPPDLG